MKAIVTKLIVLSIFLVQNGFALSYDKLIIYCSFDKSTISGNTVVNLADNGNKLYFHGTSLLATDCLGIPDRAITLDGATYLSCTIPSATISQIAQGDFSLGIMLKTTYQTGGMTARYDIAGMGDPYNNGFFLSLHDSRGRIFLGNHGYYDTPDTLSSGKWHFLLATRSNGAVKLYLDGKVSDEGAYVDAIQPSTDTFTVGKHGIKNESYFKGDLDQLVFYSRALTSDEAQLLYTEFTTIPITVLSPSDSIISSPIIFKWSSIKSAVAYAVEIDTGASFSNPIVSLPVEDTVMQLSASLSAGKYYFRIGSNSDDRSPFYFINSRYFILK